MTTRRTVGTAVLAPLLLIGLVRLLANPGHGASGPFQLQDHSPSKGEPLQAVARARATFLGGSDSDDTYEVSIAVGEDSSVYVSGFTMSQDFPVRAGAHRTEFSGGHTDRFVSRLTTDLTRMRASTLVGGRGATAGLVGGNGDDLGHAVAIDAHGNVFIAGYTESADYPVTDDAYDTEHNGGRDVFVSKFDADLTTLLASTFVGGTGDEGYQWPRIDMVVTDASDVVVVGITHSIDFPVTANAFDRHFNGGTASGDAFAIVLDNTLGTLKAATYLGGSHNEWRVGVALPPDGGIVLCGETESSDFPTSPNAYRRTLNTMKDAFIARFDDALSTLAASTLYGGSRLDEALDVAISSAGSIVVAGYTESEDLPTTPGAYRRAWSGGSRDAYAAVFAADLSRLLNATLFGGSGVDFARGLVLDSDDGVYVVGNTTSHDFPMTGVGTTGFRGGSSRGDIFLVAFDPALSEMPYSTLFGGSGEDTGYAIVIDAHERAIVAGSTTSADFPTHTQAYDPTFNGGANDGLVLAVTGLR